MRNHCPRSKLMSCIHNSTLWSFGILLSCGLSLTACGAAPDGMNTPGAAETTDTVASKICDTCDPSDPPDGGHKSDVFDIDIKEMWIPVSCDSGWEGDWAEVYWD